MSDRRRIWTHHCGACGYPCEIPICHGDHRCCLCLGDYLVFSFESATRNKIIQKVRTANANRGNKNTIYERKPSHRHPYPRP